MIGESTNYSQSNTDLARRKKTLERFTVGMSKPLKQELDNFAKNEGISLNEAVNRISWFMLRYLRAEYEKDKALLELAKKDN